MFSPSLISMIWHSLREAVPHEDPLRKFQTMGEVAHYLKDLWQLYAARPLSPRRVPVIGRNDVGANYRQFAPYAEVVEVPPRTFVFGRIPVWLLIDYFADNHWRPSSGELLDLGTPLADSAAVFGAVGSLGLCNTLIPSTGTAPTVNVALVDSGISMPGGTANNFGGKLSHATSAGIELSPHAVDVLAVLLDRLNHHGALGDAEMHCALVAPPLAPIGLACFQHANSVELLNAVTALDTHIGATALPTCVNMSLGTHVGPHDGNSPLEDFIRTKFDVASRRYMHVAAGNDGVVGLSAVRTLSGALDEFLRLTVGPTGCTEILVELWWDAAGGTGLDVTVELSQLATGITIAPLRINSRTAGTTMGPSGVTGGPTCQALFHAACHGNRSCIAFSISATTTQVLANLDVDITLSSTAPMIVNAWLVVCDDERSSFVQSASSASIRVPATDAEVVAVAGVTGTRQPWIRSSRGPTANYGAVPAPNTPPYVAHLVSHPTSGSMGTSFASPRACADSAALMRTPGVVVVDSVDLAQKIIAANGGTVGALDPRLGFGVIV